jgi:hypothetical protein
MTSVVIDTKASYLAMVHNCAKGENYMFRNLWASVDGEKTDILRDGALSCVFFVSGILYINKLLGDMHAGDGGGLERDMESSGWMLVPLEDMKPGTVLTWEARAGKDGKPHLHHGFYVGDGRAVSNGSNTTLMPEEHHYTYDGTRTIIRAWWHPRLDA